MNTISISGDKCKDFRSNNVISLSEYIPENAAKTIENGCYQHSLKHGRLTNRYFISMHDLLFNIDPESSSNSMYIYDIIHDNLDNEDLLHNLTTWSSQELDPNANSNLYKEYHIKSNIKSKIRVSLTKTCYKCNKKEVTYTCAQYRCADEDQSLSCTCNYCGHKWVE